MASPELTGFGACDVTAATIRNGQASPSSSVLTSIPSPSLRSSTKPPYSERAADPDARPASPANSSTLRGLPPAADAATTRAANEDADDARPAAIGKLLSLVTRAHNRSAPSTVSRHRATRGNIDCALRPLTRSSSRSSPPSSSTSIVVYRSSSVSEIEPTAGRLRSRSRLPQYLMRAILGWALAVALMMLDSGVIEADRTANYSPDGGALRDLKTCTLQGRSMACESRWRTTSNNASRTTPAASRPSSTMCCRVTMYSRAGCTKRCATRFSTAASAYVRCLSTLP